jgi:hypothetical protein
VVRIVGSRALGIFFPHTVGSSTRTGVCPVVIGAPTVHLAEIVGAGCVALAAAAAITMWLRGRAAASARPPPAVRAQHWKAKKIPVPLPVLSAPTHRPVACRGQKHVLANDDADGTIVSHIDEAAPRLPSTNITALAVRPLTAMHTWGRRRRH